MSDAECDQLPTTTHVLDLQIKKTSSKKLLLCNCMIWMVPNSLMLQFKTGTS